MLTEIWISWALLEFFINSSREADDLFSMTSLVIREIMKQNVNYGFVQTICVKVRFCYFVIKYQWVKEDNYCSLTIFDKIENHNDFILIQSWDGESEAFKDFSEEIYKNYHNPRL